MKLDDCKRALRRWWLAAGALGSWAALLWPRAVSAHSLWAAAPLDKTLSRYVTRTENTGERLAALFGAVAGAWLWIGISLVAFLVVVSIAAVADWHMLNLLRNGFTEFALYGLRGVRTFFRSFRDRHTPHFARLILIAGLVYWLLPIDLVTDDSILGFADDLVVAIVSAKLFVRFCPDGVIAKHATQIQSVEPRSESL